VDLFFDGLVLIVVSLLRLLTAGKLDRLRRRVAQLHAQPRTLRRDRQVSIAQSTHEIERLARLLLQREPKRIVLDVLLDGGAYMCRRAEVAVRRHHALDALMRPLEVVAIDEEPEPPRTVREVRKDRAREKLFPQRLPESLDLAERLRMLRPTLDVPDPLTTQLLLEVSLAAPRRVLAPLVRQDLFGRTVIGDPARQRLHHQHRPLMVSEGVRHDEARVVIHEGRQVQALVATQQKREDVGLPKLVRSRSFEAARQMLPRPRRRKRLGDEAFFMQNPAHLRLAHSERFEARQHVANASRPVLGVLLSLRYDRIALGFLHPRPAPTTPSTRLLDQTLHAPRLVRRKPIADRRGARAEPLRRLVDGHPPASYLFHDPNA
jgi:hypothetical protein